ncbi:LytR/AlgR family response regulator transcription factor [Eubacterium aggregans]|uniref:LytR/AlgR family response regulator transcription factor n=1 Tax=Eubacterium aggregans TaxID=81409 RepID=UPI003F3C8D8E
MDKEVPILKLLRKSQEKGVLRMIRVAICEDSPTTLQYYEYWVIKIAKKNNILIELKSFNNGYDLLFYMDLENTHFDLIYMDVEMPKINGVEVANELRDNIGYKGEIVFLTAHPEAAVEGYGINTF